MFRPLDAWIRRSPAPLGRLPGSLAIPSEEHIMPNGTDPAADTAESRGSGSPPLTDGMPAGPADGRTRVGLCRHRLGREPRMLPGACELSLAEPPARRDLASRPLARTPH